MPYVILQAPRRRLSLILVNEPAVIQFRLSERIPVVSLPSDVLHDIPRSRIIIHILYRLNIDPNGHGGSKIIIIFLLRLGLLLVVDGAVAVASNHHPREPQRQWINEIRAEWVLAKNRRWTSVVFCPLTLVIIVIKLCIQLARHSRKSRALLLHRKSLCVIRGGWGRPFKCSSINWWLLHCTEPPFGNNNDVVTTLWVFALIFCRRNQSQF